MVKRFEIYECKLCGNVVEVLRGGKGELVCCGKPMILLEEKTAEQGQEKHLPVIEKTGAGVKVKVGSVLHPMEEKHFIEWIELIMTDGGTMQKFLKPGEPPEAEFKTSEKVYKVREHCNIHGLWSSVSD